MSAKKEARKQFEKEQALERLRKIEAEKLKQLASLSPEEILIANKKLKRRKIFVLMVFGLAILLIGIALISGSSHKSIFSGKVYGVKVVDPATVNVQFTFTNTGTVAAPPNCSIHVQNAGGSYVGFDSPVMTSPVSPGASISGNINLTITGNGAQYISQGNVTCN